MNCSDKQIVAAVVVSFFPDNEILIRLLAALSGQIDYLILVDNGGGQDAANTIKAQGMSIEYIDLGKNLGLGHALNVGFEHATRFGVKYVATFDQDSAPASDLVSNLKSVHLGLEERGVDCAAVGPVFFDRREDAGRTTYFPFYFERSGRICAALREEWADEIVETDALITSGVLVRADVWSKGVRYDEGLFVDYTDTEWCFRARENGHKLFGCLGVEMGHAPSDAPPARIFGLSFFRYSPLRRFYYFRNTVRFCLARYVSRAWKLRLASALALRFFVNLVIDKKKLSSLKMMVRGVWDGLRGKTGEFVK